MQKFKICALVVSALTVTSMLAGCKRQGPASSSESESSSSEAETVILSAVDQKDEFVEFLANRSKSADQPDGFLANDRPYTVGNMNSFNVKPELTVLDAATYQPVSPSLWTYDFDVSATLAGQTEKVGAEYFSVVDAKEADIKFTEAAAGKSFTISVTPTHISESKVAQFTKSITVSVIDGYNVYDAKELGYFDTREANSDADEEDAAKSAGFVNKWQEFKTANGLDPNIKPSALLIHNDLSITQEDLPGIFFYTEAEANARSDAKAKDTLKDRTYPYKQTIERDSYINGNYFGIDISRVPLSVREDDNTKATGTVISHTALFKIDRGSLEVENLKLTGNAPRAEKDEDKIYGGGLMFIKCAGHSNGVALDNMIARDLFITVMAEQPSGDTPIPVIFSKAKCSNNYNSFIYSWGGYFTAVGCSFSNCGGPIIIQDHRGVNDQYEADNGRTIIGHAAETYFVNCELNNYVAGTEAWFQQMNVTELIPLIKGMSDLFGSQGELPKSYVVDENHVGSYYAALSAQQKASFFNFIVVNKSGSSQSATNVGVCGQVNIITTEPESYSYFDYRQPAFDSVYLAYVDYAANPTEETGAALAAAAIAAGLDIAADLSDLGAKVEEYITGICTIHEIIRGLNSAVPQGAPVFDFGSDFPLGTTDSTHMYEATSFAAYMQGGPAPTEYKTAIGAAKADIGDYVSVYYNGMMLVFKLYDYAA